MIQNIELIDFNKIKPLRSAIVNANNDLAILSAKKAYELGLIKPVLIGNSGIIKDLLIDNDCPEFQKLIVESDSEVKSAQIASNMAKNDEVSLIIKGHMHSDILMSEFINPEYNLLIKGSRLSHIWMMSFEDDRNPLIITDGALNIKPTIKTKQKIIQNCIEFTSKLNNFDPKIAILSATEKPIESLESSLDAEKLMNWAKTEMPNISIYGPLAFDNAISETAAAIKGNIGDVAGKANILIVPNIETGNALVKIMVNFMNATAGGFVVGGKLPVVITSRSHNIDSRVSSIVNSILSIN